MRFRFLKLSFKKTFETNLIIKLGCTIQIVNIYGEYFNLKNFCTITLKCIDCRASSVKNKQNTGKHMPSVRIKENEPFDIALRRFKRSCEKAGVLAKVRACEFYEKPTWVRKRKAAAAVKRNQKKVSRESRRFNRLY